MKYDKNGIWVGIKTKRLNGRVLYKAQVFGTNDYERLPPRTAKLLGSCGNNRYLEERIGF